MTHIEAMKLALEALEQAEKDADEYERIDTDQTGEAIAAFRQAIEQAEKQEPVAWLFTNLQSGDYDFCYHEDEHDHDREMWHKQPLYAAPPPRQPLTDEQKDAARYRWLRDNSASFSWQPARYNADKVSGFAAFGTGYLGFEFEEAIDRAIEAAHGIKGEA